MTDRPADLFPGQEDYQDEGVIQSAADAEMEAKIEDWATQDNAENIQPCATLYKYSDPVKGDEKAQVMYYKGSVPSRHDIGITYGGGRYMMVLTRPAGRKQPKKSTSYRFPLHANYDRLKADKDKADAAAAITETPAGQSVHQGPYRGDNQAQVFKETFGMVQNMMATVFTMLTPILNKALLPPIPQIAGPTPATPADQFGMFAMMKDVLKNQTRADIDFYQDMKKGFLTMQSATDTEENLDPEAGAPDKPGMLERILAIAEPFIPMLAQNTTQARIAAAGIKAMPQVQAAVKDITSNPALLQKIVSYVEKKEGREGAIIALRNMGIKVAADPLPATPKVIAPKPVIRPSIKPKGGKK